MTASSDPFEAAVANLDSAVSQRAPGQERDWANRVEQALGELEQVVRQRAAALQSAPEGKVVDVDRPRLPSPTVDRRLDGLCQELEGFLRETGQLRQQVRGAAEAFGLSINPSNLAGALAVAPEAGAIPDFGVFCQRARELIKTLREYEAEEAQLVLESVNTDIGAGD